ncbi:unnamed protein product [Candidula unifasciata]|uniref:Uncharacterized protein n=1 Tax=Candidula unifasciata TaxID=100452 RepID=A0A8S3ZJS1_9EUPU|nr:unnamed protein product [Candidula unifasciata]
MALTLSQLRKMAPNWSLLQPDSLVSAETLLSVEQVPDVLKEPYIFTGYRPMGRPWKYYCLLDLHNESVNIWSHTIGFFLVLLRLVHFFSDLDLLQDKVAWPALGFGLSCLLSLTLSAAAHLLHSRSRWHHFLFFLMDYMGVTFYSFGTGIISMFTCSSRGYHDALHGWFLPANVFFSWLSFFVCCIAKTHLSHDNGRGVSMGGLGPGFFPPLGHGSGFSHPAGSWVWIFIRLGHGSGFSHPAGLGRFFHPVGHGSGFF